MTKAKAALLHLGISVGIAFGIMLVLRSLYYPGALWEGAGVASFLIILLGVDVIAGPLLTLVVFRQGKPGLRRDLAMVALAQTLALAYGLNVLWQTRPIFLVAAVDRITMVTAGEIPEEQWQGAFGRFARAPAFGALLVGAKLPEEPAARSALAMEVMEGAVDLELRPSHYVQYEEVAEEIYSRAKPIAHDNETLTRAAERAAKAHGLDVSEIRILPLKAPRMFVSALVAPDGRVLDTLPVDPW